MAERSTQASPQMQNAAQPAEPTTPKPEDAFGQALNRVRMDWPDARQYERSMWELWAMFNELPEEASAIRWELWLMSLYLTAKLLYGPQGADVDELLVKPVQTVQ
jgi:hypothetical protein